MKITLFSIFIGTYDIYDEKGFELLNISFGGDDRSLLGLYISGYRVILEVLFIRFVL